MSRMKQFCRQIIEAENDLMNSYESVKKHVDIKVSGYDAFLK